MVDIPHSSLTAAADLHEPKGASTASAGQVYVADGAGSGSFKTPLKVIEQAAYDYNDLTTVTTPIPLTVADTDYELTNDGDGPFTNKTYAYTDIDDLWNTTTNRFDFTGLSLGDTVDIRFDVEFTTSSVNTAIELSLELGLGGNPYTLPLIPSVNLKTAASYEQIRWFGIYMGDANTLDNPARLLAKADGTGVTVKVNGWYIRPMRNVTVVS